MKPYWQSSDGHITVYHARWEEVLAGGGSVPMREIALIHADPPYGIDVDLDGGAARRRPERGNSLGKVTGDDRPFDPYPLLALERPTVLWGANNFAARLPASSAWFTWDKRVSMPSDDRSDCEMAWTNIGNSARIFRHVWKGTVRDSERGPTLHPTQKPIALCTWVYERAKLKRGDLVFVPHGGSGPDLPACVAMGLRLIWCDVERWCCDTAVSRLNAITPERAAEPAGPLFSPRGAR